MSETSELLDRVDGLIAQAEALAACELTEEEREMLSIAVLKIGSAVSAFVERELLGDG